MSRRKPKLVTRSPIQKAMNARRTGGGVHRDKRRSKKTEQKQTQEFKDVFAMNEWVKRFRGED